ncbi:MAG: OsmC family protein [candidate division Zixibacteria bacterium]
MNIEMNWRGGYKFSGQSMYGHEISTDASKKIGGAEDGYQPLELLMFGLAGCTGIDVVLIAGKMKQEITDFRIKIEAEQREESPRAFIKAHIEYIFEGKNLDRNKLEKAIKLSDEKYCSASATLKGVTEITHSCIIKGE